MLLDSAPGDEARVVGVGVTPYGGGGGRYDEQDGNMLVPPR